MFALFTKLYVTELSDPGYIEYGAGDFDGQNSGHDFYGVSNYFCTVLRLGSSQSHLVPVLPSTL